MKYFFIVNPAAGTRSAEETLRGALISYEGTNAKELVEDFHGAVDDYIALCEAENKKPEKAYKGSFNVRVSPELHKQAVICAASHQMTLNSFVEGAMRQALASAN